ncbi:C6 transcription factor [Aspergillus egyptiacus]|nr:C6 transcription factor [Aspergillus egyptiacus]
MAESPAQHRAIAPGPSPHHEAPAPGGSPPEDRRSSPECTKKRCSGEPPCENCRAFHRECIFDETLDQRRRVAAKRTADELDYHREMLNDLMKVVRDEDVVYGQRLFEIIRRGASSDDIRAYIDSTLRYKARKGAENEETARELERARTVDIKGPELSVRRQVMDIRYMCDRIPYRVPAQPWTTVTKDADLVSHLVSLYFTWAYPFHVFLDRDVFLKHMARGYRSSLFCSPFLVNALLASACHFCDYSEAYGNPGDIITKGDNFLTEAERLKHEEPAKTLPYLQGTLMLYEKYSLAGTDDLGYTRLHEAIKIGEEMGLVSCEAASPLKLEIETGTTFQELDQADREISQDMDTCAKRTAQGLFHIDTVVHTAFLRASLIKKINYRYPPEKHPTDNVVSWVPYPTHRNQRPSYVDDYFEQSCNLCIIARDISHRLFAIEKETTPLDQWNQTKEALYERLRGWRAELPASFNFLERPPPYIIVLRMWYCTLVINLLLYKAEEEALVVEAEGIKTPESPTDFRYPSKYNVSAIIQSAAREIGALARLHRREYGLSRAHHFAIYAMNLALFVMVEQVGVFDILDTDFLLLASAFSNIANRSHLGQNLFHLFRQRVRKKCQGSRIRESRSVSEELKALFDERCTLPSVFDGYATGLEKLDNDERYRGLMGNHPLSEMLDTYETLSLGKDEIAPRRQHSE